MNSYKSLLFCCALCLAVPLLDAQTEMVLGRVIGQNSLSSVVQSAAPNLVEGRELNNPQNVALDLSATPPILYVSDTGNNRVLGWKDATTFANGAPADIVIGQKDLLSTWGNGPGTAIPKGLFQPTGLLVDAHGNLYVADCGNNRVLRFPQPFNQSDVLKLPDQVIGQPDFNTRTANTGGISASTLALSTSAGVLVTSLAFDPAGNLWVTDAGNHRVLRYPADAENAGSVVVTADTVIGQATFLTSASTTTINKTDQLNMPAGLAFDTTGNLYVADALERVLVFRGPKLSNGQAAFSFIGEAVDAQGHVIVTPPTARSLNSPGNVTVLPTNEVLVADTANSRVLKFPPISLWPAAGQPSATTVIGQPDYLSFKPAVGASGLAGPAGLAASVTELYVADSANNRVLVFPLDVPQIGAAATRVLGQLGFDYNAPNLIEGRELNALGFLPVGGGNALAIRGDLIVDHSEAVPHLYISDPGNNRVLAYCDARKAKAGDKADLVIGQKDFFHSSANGDGGIKTNDQNLWLPSGLVVDASGNLLVADSGNGRVLRFAAPCDQPPASQSFPHANLVLGQPNFQTHNTDPNARTMGVPMGLTFTPEGDLEVSDAAFNRVVRLDKPPGTDFSNGQSAAAVFGQPDFLSTSSGSLPNQMNSPRYIAADASSRLFVCDYGNNRVMVFTDSAHAKNGPQSVLQVTASDATNHALKGPYGIAISSITGDVWVAELGEARVLHYPEYGELALNPVAIGQVLTATDGTAIYSLPIFPVGVALDSGDNLLALDTGNRVGLYFTQMLAVSGANYLPGHPLTPGMLASAWAKFKPTPATHAPGMPLPRDLAGVQVLVNGTAAPLLYAGDSGYPGVIQVNFQVPNNAPTTGTTTIQVAESDTQQMWDAGAVAMAAAAPAFFTVNQQGTGQVAAQNGDDANRPDGLFTCNGPTAAASPACPGGTRPVKRNEVIILYLTGAGFQPDFPADGMNATGAASTDGAKPRVVIGTQYVPDDNVQYSGVAPCCVGLWQINVKVPNDNVAPGVANPVVVVYRDVPSSINGVPATTIMIQ